jgi:hypothetical protein
MQFSLPRLRAVQLLSIMLISVTLDTISLPLSDHSTVMGASSLVSLPSESQTKQNIEHETQVLSIE